MAMKVSFSVRDRQRTVILARGARGGTAEQLAKQIKEIFALRGWSAAKPTKWPVPAAHLFGCGAHQNAEET
jgi:hypothetical protein